MVLAGSNTWPSQTIISKSRKLIGNIRKRSEDLTLIDLHDRKQLDIGGVVTFTSNQNKDDGKRVLWRESFENFFPKLSGKEC